MSLRGSPFRFAVVCRRVLLALSLASAFNTTGSVFAQDNEDAEAQARFTAGEIAFGAGRFDDALSDFQRAYQLSERPELLFNIGLAADRVRNDALALESFDRFLELLPEHPNAEEVRGRVQAIRRSQQNRTDLGTGDSDADSDANSDADGMGSNVHNEAPSRAGPWALGIGGGVMLIGGTVLLALALSDKSEIESMTDPVRWPTIQGQVESVPRRSGAGIALLAVGAAAALSAVVWRVMTPSENVNVSVGAGSVLVEGRF